MEWGGFGLLTPLCPPSPHQSTKTKLVWMLKEYWNYSTSVCCIKNTTQEQKRQVGRSAHQPKLHKEDVGEMKSNRQLAVSFNMRYQHRTEC